MKTFARAAFAACILLSGLSGRNALAGAEYDKLTPEQKNRVQNGEVVVVTQEDSSSVWPKTWVYRRIDSTPEEMAAVFADFELVPGYMKMVKSVKVSGRPAKNIFDVDYELEVPLFPNETYTTRDTLAHRGDGYEVSWSLVKASSTKASVGYARFEALGTGAFIAYYNFVTPGMTGAGLVKERALRQVIDTVNAIANQTVKERKDQRALLDRQVAILRNATDGVVR